MFTYPEPVRAVLWLIPVILLISSAIVVILWRRRRRTGSTALRDGRRAIQRLSRDQRRRRRGNIRGTGQGGDDSLALDASTVGD